jgi:alkylresorcinol/alkylpyrone synthase
LQRGPYATRRAATVHQPLTAARRRARTPGARIAGLAVSDSPQTLSQDQVLERLGLAGDEFAERIFARSGVKRRHLRLDDEFLDSTLRGRAAAVEQDLLAHSVAAIDAIGVDLSRVGAIFSASLYSLGVPSLAHRLVEHYEMDPATDKYHLTGVGCASAVPLMRLGAQALQADPEQQVLVVAAENMSSILTRSLPGDPRAKTIGAALFGDGCAAALLSAGPGGEGPVIAASQVHQVPDTLDAVRLHCDQSDGYLQMSRELPDTAGEALPGVVERFLASHGVEREEIEHWIVHPGGRRIIENVQSALELSDEQVELSWNALAEHGNVGTPSAMYVLKDTIEQARPEPGEKGLMVTIGPGVSVGLMLLGW